MSRGITEGKGGKGAEDLARFGVWPRPRSGERVRGLWGVVSESTILLLKGIKGLLAAKGVFPRDAGSRVYTPSLRVGYNVQE